jgi:hypothetical protein
VQPAWSPCARPGRVLPPRLMSRVQPRHGLKVADEVWIATALMHREEPDRADFSVREIVGRVSRENLTGSLRGSVHVHVVQHCVANRAPNPAGYRMLLETSSGRRRLYRPGDPHHPDRRGRIHPERRDVPEAYRHLLDWYETGYAREGSRAQADPLLALRGSGRHLWAEEHADDYVKRLREGWA